MLTCATYLCAMPIEIVLNEETDIKQSNSHPSAHPKVEYNDDEIIIKSDSVIYDINVVVKDQYGDIIHNSTITASQIGTIIYVPEYDGSEKSTIDIYFNRKHLNGNF